ncbi:MAG: helicase [Methanobrevibacter thaueri]|nr:helicase [Methanobrevibacter thaueri]
MKEYHQIEDLPIALQNEIKNNASFFDNFDGKSLDEQQRIACVLNDCDLEIIAGAGTGKTHTLLAKAAYLIEKKNISPDDILFLSFSKSCVEELIERLNYNVPTSTIHAYGLSLIDEYREKEVFDGWGFKKIFDEYLETASDKQISDIKDYCMENLKSEDMIKLIELDTEIEKFNHMVSKSRISSRIRSFIDLFKGKGYRISDFNKIKSKCKHEFETREGSYYTEENYLRNMAFIQLVEPVYRFYESYLHRNHLIDFNDMINRAIELIENEGLSNNFKYVFVDEYQDMSYKNFQFIKTLKESCNANLVVVGDDWQSIYGFRDSDISLFNDFCDYFPNANKVFIEKTYRNPQELIDIAGKFIMKNDSQFKKSLKSDTSIENPVKIVYDDDPDSIYNLINNLSKDSERVFILGRHNGDIDDFIFGTDLSKKSKKEYKQITNDYGTINNVEYRTVHKAKGLEADYVVLINVFNQQVGFPNKLYPPYFMNLMHDWDYDKKLEEERRLFYVAITRAKKGVYIFTRDYKQSEYIDELIGDNDLELIYGEDFNKFDEFDSMKEENIFPSNIKSELFDSTGVDVSKGIEIKANQKDHGNKIMKSKDYDEAEDFYKKLITNMYYLNDYYPFRQLVKVYIKKKEYGNVINTIEEFFKSERYCSGSQLLWFKFKYKKACKYTGRRFSQFDECLEYFNEHGLKNKDKQNEPVPIAARLQTGRTKVKIIPQEDYDRKMEYEELRLTFKYADKYESKKKALYYYEQLWDRREFTKNLTAYRKLCSLYYDTQQYEKVLEVADEYFNSSARKTDSGISWFDKKVDQASKKLGKTPAQKTQQKPIKTTDIPPKNSVNANTMSNDELLIKYAELCEKGYLTRDEFDKKKKELLFNDSPVKQDTSSKIDENHLDTPVITISCSNFRKLIRYNIGDIINVKYRRDNIQLEIVETDNPGHVYDDLEDNLKLTVVKENFNIIRSLNEGELIIIKCKGRSEEVVLKFVGV